MKLNYFQLLETAKNYSTRIFKQYQQIEQLILNNQQGTTEYQETIKKLKENIEFDDYFIAY